MLWCFWIITDLDQCYKEVMALPYSNTHSEDIFHYSTATTQQNYCETIDDRDRDTMDNLHLPGNSQEKDQDVSNLCCTNPQNGKTIVVDFSKLDDFISPSFDGDTQKINLIGSQGISCLTLRVKQEEGHEVSVFSTDVWSNSSVSPCGKILDIKMTGVSIVTFLANTEDTQCDILKQPVLHETRTSTRLCRKECRPTLTACNRSKSCRMQGDRENAKSRGVGNTASNSNKQKLNLSQGNRFFKCLFSSKQYFNENEIKVDLKDREEKSYSMKSDVNDILKPCIVSPRPATFEDDTSRECFSTFGVADSTSSKVESEMESSADLSLKAWNKLKDTTNSEVSREITHLIHGEEFSNKETFPTRVTLHSEERPFKCPVCKKGFKSVSNLSVHKLSHLTEKPHKCRVCDKSFISKGKLDVHSRSHTGEKPFSCSICEIKFVSSNTLQKHMKWMHLEEKPLKCDKCGKRFSQQSYLEAHRSSHAKSKAYKCDTCGRCYKHSHVLKLHQRIHTEDQAFKCEHCSKLFPRLGDLKAHLPTHTKERPFVCHVCGKTFTHQTSLNVHQKSHNLVKQSYKCIQCGKTFAHSSSLYKHIGRTHPKDKKLECHICNKIYTNSGHLQSHLQGHADKPVFSCPVCNKEHRRLREMKIHMMSHTGEKPYKCSICNKGFVRKSHLETHKHIHNDERHFLCELCGMKFKQKPSLMGHKKTHLDAKPISCDICGKGFRINSKMLRHKNSHFRKQQTLAECS